MPDDIRVASVPSGHVYVRHLSPVHDDAAHPAVTRLTDPDPAQPGRAAASVWWPPAMLEPDWVERTAAEFDLMHLQFGFDAWAPEHLERLVAALRRHRKPLVYTVHDLRNPHHPRRDEHDAQLDVLIPAADALITLTEGAADEIEARWGRRPAVLPHPHVVEAQVMARLQRDPVTQDHGPFRIGVHVKSLRASMNPVPVLEVLLRVVADLPDAVLQVDGHSDVLLPDGARFDPALAALVGDAARAGALEARVHDYFSDDDLWAYLRSLDVSVLPYRFGTHSGWLEACRDLGTIVVAPDCGYYRDQGPVVEYHNDEDGLDAASLEAAIRLAYETRPYSVASIEYRMRQRDEIAARHADVYASLVS